MLYSIVNEDPQPLSRFRTDVPEYLASIIERALQKEPANRYQAIGDLLSDLKSADASPSERLRPTRKQHSIAVLPFLGTFQLMLSRSTSVMVWPKRSLPG